MCGVPPSPLASYPRESGSCLQWGRFHFRYLRKVVTLTYNFPLQGKLRTCLAFDLRICIACNLLPSTLAFGLPLALLPSSLWAPPTLLSTASPSQFPCLCCLNSSHSAEALCMVEKEEGTVKWTDVGLVSITYRFLCWMPVAVITA